MAFTREDVQPWLQTVVFGRQLEVEPTLSSTNTRCRELARLGAPEGTAVAAVTQTAGRGRRGRQFFSPEGGVYLSVLLRPKGKIDPGLITCCGAVAAREAICSLCDAPVEIKWVNDLLLHGRKISGILAEGEPLATGEFAYVVLGFGINVGQMTFPPELTEVATSLGNAGYALSPERLVAALLNAWERLYKTLDTGAFLEEYRRHCLLIGKQVTVHRGEDCYPATALAVTDEGGLLVRREDGKECVLRSGEVRVRW